MCIIVGIDGESCVQVLNVIGICCVRACCIRKSAVTLLCKRHSILVGFSDIVSGGGTRASVAYILRFPSAYSLVPRALVVTTSSLTYVELSICNHIQFVCVFRAHINKNKSVGEITSVGMI